MFMKKLLMILAIAVMGGKAMAQAPAYVLAGVSTGGDVFYQNLEIGATTGKNSLAVVAESFNAGNDLSVNKDREYSLGLKYTRAIPVGKNLSFLMSGAAKIQLGDVNTLSVEPGVGMSLNVSKRVAVVGGMSSPVFEGTSPFRPLYLKGGIGLRVVI